MSDLGLNLDDIAERIRRMGDTEREQLVDQLHAELQLAWQPQPGPQFTAYHSQADEMLYGGAAGGGKTDLVCGLATTLHERTLIFRRQSTDLDGIWERLEGILDPISRISTRNGVKKHMRTIDGRVVDMGHLEKPGSEKSWQGRPHDLICFDEAAQLDELKVEFVMRWLRSTTPGQRCRVVFATNPPVPDLKDGSMTDVSTGDWLKRWFAPWIDPDLPEDQKAKSGELRWCYMRTRGNQYETVWVDGPGWYVIKTGEQHVGEPTQAQIKSLSLASSKSRTFVQSLVTDNQFLAGTGYLEKLSATPEPLRTMLLHGAFGIKLADHDMQVIPTNWVLTAQDRWREYVSRLEADHDMRKAAMRVLAADIAQGGADITVLAPLREDGFFEELQTFPGSETPDGPSVVARILKTRRDRATIALDMTGGWGISTRDNLRDNHRIAAISCVASAGSTAWTRDMSLRFYNLRAEMWWKFREALDPDENSDIMLPPGDRLRAQLTAPHFGVRGNQILVEAKDDVRKRIGTSTDEADAVIMAKHYLPTAMAREHSIDPIPVELGGWNEDLGDFRKQTSSVPEIDPLGDWDI